MIRSLQLGLQDFNALKFRILARCATISVLTWDSNVIGSILPGINGGDVFLPDGPSLTDIQTSQTEFIEQTKLLGDGKQGELMTLCPFALEDLSHLQSHDYFPR